MPETFAQYLEKWLKQSTAQGLNNPLVKMPIKRFSLLQPHEFESIANGGSLIIGTISDPIARNLYKNSQTRIRERGNRASKVTSDSYIGLFSSQQMVVQQRLTEPPLRQVLARNPIVKAKIEDGKVGSVDLGEITDDGLEELGIVLPCDDSQLRVVQLTNYGFCLQVEGPPGTGKSQTIANIISNALYFGRSVLLVCDKKVAIAQVEERLANCGLKPAMLNLHDEDLDKREFLRQATDKFQTDRFGTANYPFDQLRETRKTLNDRGGN